MRQNRLKNFIVLLCLSISSIIFSDVHAQEASKPKPVEVATPQRGTIEQKVTYTGNLEPDAMVEIHANISGKLVALKVDDGVHVSKGDRLAAIDSRELRLGLKQAEAALTAAQARLLTVKATAQIQAESQLETARALLEAAVAQLKQAQALAHAQATAQFEQAKAGVTAATANLEKAKKGARSQEVQQAKAVLKAAKAGLENANATFMRVQKLHEKEAISDRDLDNAKAQFQGAAAQHESAAEQLSLVEAGARQEDITAAEAQVQQAAAALTLARVTMETEDWQQQLILVESQVRQASANLQTAEKLVEIRAWEHDIAAAQAQFDQANEQVNLAKKRLADATVTAPVTGIVVNRTADLGDYAAAAGVPGATPILTIVKMDVVKAVFTVSETDLSNVTVGTPVGISAGQQQIAGHIGFISPLVQPQDRSINVTAEIPNPEYQLKPGMFVEVSIESAVPDDLLLLPRGAVLDIQNGIGHVFVATDNTARQQSVKIGLTWGDSISILEGVSDTTAVIVRGHRQLTDGSKILVVK